MKLTAQFLSCIRCSWCCAFTSACHNCDVETFRLKVTVTRLDIIAASGWVRFSAYLHVIVEQSNIWTYPSFSQVKLLLEHSFFWNSGNEKVSYCPETFKASFAVKVVLNVAYEDERPTSYTALYFSRSSEDFLNQQLSVLPLPKESVSVYSARAISWLLKTVAIELKILSQTRQRSLITRMTMLLLDGRRHAATSGSGQVRSLFSYFLKQTISF